MVSVQVDADYSLWKEWNAFWPLVEGFDRGQGVGTTPDVSGHGYDAVYENGVFFNGQSMVLDGGGTVYVSPIVQSVVTDGGVGKGLDGGTGGRIDGGEVLHPVVDVTGSYSVSVWVEMDDTTGYRTFVSADGSQVSEFYLQKRGDTNRFAFTLTVSDSNDGAVSPLVCVAMAPSLTPQLETQYHLVGTRDALTGDDKLYVNGFLASTKNCPSSKGAGWSASTFGIGYGMYNGAKTYYVSGQISDVGLIGRVLSSDEVLALFELGSGLP